MFRGFAVLTAMAIAASAAAAAISSEPSQTESCLACHAAQQKPLAQSRHGMAFSPGLSGQLPQSGPHVGSGLACLLCHAPAADQQPWRSLAAAPTGAAPGETPVEAWSGAISGAGVAPNPGFEPHARALGVSCTACHLHRGEIVGTRADPASPHPVKVDATLQSPALCGRCHQFGTDATVNGKPLENIVAESQDSAWGKAGATCQSCHMPAGRHLFQGIHSPELVAASVEVSWTQQARGRGELSLTNSAVGHDFPSYVTPRIFLAVQPEDARGRPVGAPVTLELGRRVHFADGRWMEDSDTRVPPGQSRALHYALSLPEQAVRLHATVRVSPDENYVAVYRDLLRAGGALPAERRAELQAAEEAALRSAYRIFDETRNVLPP